MDRHVLCAGYSACLSVAAKTNRPFDCSACERRRSEPPDFERRLSLYSDLYGSKLLLCAIFHPCLYRQYRELRTIREAGGVVAEACGIEKGAGNHTSPGEIVEPEASPAVGLNVLDS